MYYFPAMIIFDSEVRSLKTGIPFAVITMAVSLVVFLGAMILLGDNEAFSSFTPVIFSSSVTVIGTVMLLINRVVYLLDEGEKLWRTLVMPVLYVLIAALVVSVTVYVIPTYNSDKYDSAVSLLELGKYKEARDEFLELGRYKNSAEIYQSIKFKNLEIGEKVSMGVQATDYESGNGKYALSWTVVGTEDGKALLLADEIVSSLRSNPLSYWIKGNNVRNALIELEYLFDETERERIVSHTYEIDIGGESLTATDKFFILSQAELEQYLDKSEIFSGKQTPYNRGLISSIDFDQAPNYYVRDVNANGDWIVAECGSKAFLKQSTSYVGLRPAMYIEMDN